MIVPVKTIGLKVLNMNKQCVLVRKLVDGTITIPTMSIPIKDDPILLLNPLLGQINGDYKIIDVLSILNEAIDSDGNSYVIYELHYTGKMLTTIPEKWEYIYADSQWIQTWQLKRQHLNTITSLLMSTEGWGFSS